VAPGDWRAAAGFAGGDGFLQLWVRPANRRWGRGKGRSEGVWESLVLSRRFFGSIIGVVGEHPVECKILPRKVQEGHKIR